MIEEKLQCQISGQAQIFAINMDEKLRTNTHLKNGSTAIGNRALNPHCPHIKDVDLGQAH
jgi:hypothetical protein